MGIVTEGVVMTEIKAESLNNPGVSGAQGLPTLMILTFSTELVKGFCKKQDKWVG